MLRHRACAMLALASFIAAPLALQAAGRPMRFRLSNVRDVRACPSPDSNP
jgi:hypothetical protein